MALESISGTETLTAQEKVIYQNFLIKNPGIQMTEEAFKAARKDFFDSLPKNKMESSIPDHDIKIELSGRNN